MPTRRQLALPITVDRAVPLHRGLYDALRDAMLHGRLRPRTRLPSSRDLATQLGIARGTVVEVYAQLTSEGYLETVHGSGTFVAAELPDRWFSTPASPASQPMRRKPRLSTWGRAAQTTPFPIVPRRTPRPFRAHVPAVDAFPTEVWGRIVARRARRDEALLTADGDVRGHRPLREALAEHLAVSRGVACTADRIVITPSALQTLDLVARMTLDPGDRAWVEDPGYVAAAVVLQAAGAILVPVQVDAQGIDVAAGIQAAPDARLVHVTPGHQSPLGVTLTAERRIQLLQWAGARGATVIEDDYDSEYRYEERPVPALQSLDRAGVVVHAGTFSKTLLPSLRLAYAVLPDGLVEPFLRAKSIVDRYTPPLLQAALADFIDGGHFGRHLRRMRELYGERRAALLDAIARELGDRVEVVGASAGIDVAVRLAASVDDVALAARLGEASIEALPLSRFATDRRGRPGLVLGFAAFSPARLRRSVATLARVLGA